MSDVTPAHEIAPERPRPSRIGGRTFTWGARTYVVGILNVTPDSFSGDGLLAPGSGSGPGSDAVLARAVAAARQMIDEGADILDIGGESTRPGHRPVSGPDEISRVVPVIQAIRAELPESVISVDTTKLEVAAAALDAGADLLNDVWGVGPDDRRVRLAAGRSVPIILMHNRAEPIYRDVVAEVIADLGRAIERAIEAGCSIDSLIVDPGFGFGKTPEHNLEIVRRLSELHVLGRPILLGTSRKSTLGRVLDLPPEERLEATLATSAIAVAAGVDLVRVHDVRANLRVTRLCDAIFRAGMP
jgi:dihydropteroate synthase